MAETEGAEPETGGAAAGEQSHRESIATTLAAQVQGGGGYDDSADPEALPPLVFRPGWHS